MGKAFTILGFAGSIRKESYNHALLKKAVEITPKNLLLETITLSEIPL